MFSGPNSDKATMRVVEAVHRARRGQASLGDGFRRIAEVIYPTPEIQLQEQRQMFLPPIKRQTITVCVIIQGESK